jgi:hypothetical protein
VADGVSRSILARMVLSAACGGACASELDVTDVEGDPRPCEGSHYGDLAPCELPVTRLYVVETETAEVLFAGADDGSLHRLERVSSTGAWSGESRNVAVGFASNTNILSCDLDGEHVPELIVSSNDAIDPGFLLWNGHLEEDATRSSRVPPGPLWRATCVDVDRDGAADLVGSNDEGDLVVFRGGPEGFATDPLVVPIDIEPALHITRSDVAHVEGCPASLLAIRDLARDRIQVIAFDAPSAGVLESSELELDTRDRPVQAILFDRFDNGDPMLVVTTLELDGTSRLEVFAAQGCAVEFEPLGSLAFSQIRHVHSRLGPSPELIVVGNEIDGVAVVEPRLDGAPVMTQTWDVVAIDAEIVRLADDPDPMLVISSAGQPYLERLPL